MGYLMKLICTVLLTGLAVGCAALPYPQGEIASNTTAYNLVVEQAQNEMLLLNIIRASKRRPMYFTSLNLVHGSMTYGLSTGSLTLPFGKYGLGAGSSSYSGAYGIAPTASYSSNPVFDVAVLDNKEFISGMLTPVDMNTVDYYLNKLGWPKEMLLHLFVRSIEFVKDGEVVEHYENYPEDRDVFEKFQNKLRAIIACQWTSVEKTSPIGPKLSVRDVSSLEQLIKMQAAGLSLIPEKDSHLSESYQMSSKRTEYALSCKDEKAKVQGASDKKEQRNTYSILSFPSVGSEHEPVKGEAGYRLYFRSPEAILYYLGEIARAELDYGYTPKIEVCQDATKKVPLFVVKKELEKGTAAAVTAEYEGSKYFVPRITTGDSDHGCKEDRSMHVLSFVSLLISQHKVGMTTPATGVVSIIGGK
jgi:hypothetical protein